MLIKKSLGAGVALSLLMSAGGASAQTPAAQIPSSAPNTGVQSPQDPGNAALLATCKIGPAPRAPVAPRPAAAAPATPPAAPPFPAVIPPPSPAIPGVLAANQSWKSVWQWDGNNVDGPVPTDHGTFLVANNDAGTVMEINPANGTGKVLYSGLRTPGSVGMANNGALFVGERALHAAIVQLAPTRKVFTDKFDNGDPLDCSGGIINDIAVSKRGDVYMSGPGVIHANPQGVAKRYGEGVRSNGIVLSPDDKILYATNGGTVVAFDVAADGSLSNQRDFGKMNNGRGGDGSAVDSEGRLYVGGGGSVDVFSPTGQNLGTIVGPQGLHGVFFGGPQKKTMYGILLYGTAPNRHNQVVALQMESQGYMGRAK